MFLLDGKRLTPGVAFTHGDIQYPANWLTFASPEEREAIGIVEIAESVRPNDEFYWVTDNNDGTYTSTPKLLDDRAEVDENGDPVYVRVYDIATNSMVNTEEQMVTKGLKSSWIQRVKETANSLLKNTDWMVIRKAERGVAIPTAIATKRAAIVDECDRLETAIAACANVEALIAVVMDQRWPREEI